MKKYKCMKNIFYGCYVTPCKYVYDEEKGDLEHDIASGTKFEDLPTDWVCPLCGEKKEKFEEYN